MLSTPHTSAGTFSTRAHFLCHPSCCCGRNSNDPAPHRRTSLRHHLSVLHPGVLTVLSHGQKQMCCDSSSQQDALDLGLSPTLSCADPFMEKASTCSHTFCSQFLTLPPDLSPFRTHGPLNVLLRPQWSSVAVTMVCFALISCVQPPLFGQAGHLLLGERPL